MRGRKKPWAAPYLSEHPEIVAQKIDLDDSFFASEKLFLEVGIGKGDFIVAMANKQEGHYLGIEKEGNVLAMAVRKVADQEIKNIRLLQGDFDIFSPELSSLRFDAIYLNFSDPWPKKRHWKRRLTASNRLEQMKGMLKEGGRIVVKTDNDDLFAFTLEQAPLAGLTIEHSTTDYVFDEEHDAMSEYERRFRSQGKNINRTILVK